MLEPGLRDQQERPRCLASPIFFSCPGIHPGTDSRHLGGTQLSSPLALKPVFILRPRGRGCLSIHGSHPQRFHLIDLRAAWAMEDGKRPQVGLMCSQGGEPCSSPIRVWMDRPALSSGVLTPAVLCCEAGVEGPPSLLSMHRGLGEPGLLVWRVSRWGGQV